MRPARTILIMQLSNSRIDKDRKICQAPLSILPFARFNPQMLYLHFSFSLLDYKRSSDHPYGYDFFEKRIGNGTKEL